MENFLSSKEYLSKSTDHRRSNNPQNTCEYGIDFLDDQLGGIGRGELIVIGADFGVGKTELSSQIAIHNAKQGKKVAFFKLEGCRHEFADTQKYKLMMEIQIKEQFTGVAYLTDFTYTNYRLNKVPDKELINRLEDEATRRLEPILENLFLYDKTEALNKENVIQKISAIHNEVDLIIIDHLHYFDMFCQEKENAELTQIMKTINDVVETMRVPVILVSHLRKRINPKIIVPDKEDFMGSSNIYKIAYTCILLTRITIG